MVSSLLGRDVPHVRGQTSGQLSGCGFRTGTRDGGTAMCQRVDSARGILLAVTGRHFALNKGPSFRELPICCAKQHSIDMES